MAHPRERAGSRSYQRISRVNVLLRRVLAEEIERLVDADDRLALLTLTEVICENDLRHAVVYFATLSPEAKEALEERRKSLQAVLATEMRMRRIPLLSFAADPAVAAGEAIEQALRRAKRPLDAGDPGESALGQAESSEA